MLTADSSPSAVSGTRSYDSETERWVCKQIPRLRWLVWHGRWVEVLPLLTRLSRATKLAMRSSDFMAHERLGRFRRHAVELHRYLRNNSRGLINYGLAWRSGQRISTAPAESGIGHLVKERMSRGKPIRWSADGANLLLQVRCAVLDDRLDELFREWYPRFQRTPWTVGGVRWQDSVHLEQTNLTSRPFPHCGRRSRPHVLGDEREPFLPREPSTCPLDPADGAQSRHATSLRCVICHGAMKGLWIGGWMAKV